ncbi:MAG TPA: hypothetical protein VK472_06105 [Allosphingosinicella sp.]|nr:hypothetical protein [Allosphingosinicella sp.]
MFRFVAFLLLALAVSAPAPESRAQPAAGDALRGGGREVMNAVQRHYPADYARIMEALGRHAAEHPEDVAGRAALGRRLLLDFFKLRARGLANAPAPLVNDIVGRHLLLLRLLARDDTALCADLATNLLIGRFDLPAFYQDRATSLSVSIVEAAKEGEKLPRDPARAGLATDDSTRWYEELLRVEPSSDIQAAIAADSAAASGSPEMQCRVSAAIFGATERLSPEQAANVGAFFLAQTLAEPGHE